MSYEYDLLVIGAGSGGVRAARWAASFGAKVAICESDRFGGTCVLRGCIPKKLMVYGGHFADDIKTARDYGWEIDIKDHNWTDFCVKRQKELTRLSGLYENTLNNNKVDMIKGSAQFINENEVDVNGKSYSAKNILIAVGGKPWHPQFQGSELCIDSNQFLELKNKPKKVTIIGGGFIALEFACLLHHFGTEVHVAVRSETVLRGFDSECANFLKDQIKASGIHIHENVNIKEVKKESDQLHALFSNNLSIECDQVIVATGRKPNTQKLGLDKAKIKTKDNGAIIVDEFFKSSNESVYALGDVTDRLNLTPVALQEAMIVTENLFAKKTSKSINYTLTPKAVFTTPPLSCTGVTQDELNDLGKVEGTDYEVYTSNFRPLKYSLGDRNIRSFMKLIVDIKTDVVLGAHMVGDDAAEIMQGVAIAVAASLTKEQFDATIGIHPTSAEEFTTMRSARKVQ